MWEFFMHYPAAAGSFGTHLRWGEGAGWVTLILSVGGLVKAIPTLFGTITPELINPWLILIASTVTGAVAVGTLAYSRLVRAKLDGETLEAIYAANNEAIRKRQPVPFPAFLPKGAIQVTATTVIDVTAKTPPPPPPEAKP